MQHQPHKEGSLLVHLLEFVELAKMKPPSFTYPPYMAKERLQTKYSWTLAKLNEYNTIIISAMKVLSIVIRLSN